MYNKRHTQIDNKRQHHTDEDSNDDESNESSKQSKLHSTRLQHTSTQRYQEAVEEQAKQQEGKARKDKDRLDSCGASGENFVNAVAATGIFHNFNMDAKNIVVANDDDFDSIALAVYDAIDGSPSQRTGTDMRQLNSSLEDEDDDEEIRRHYNKSGITYSRNNKAEEKVENTQDDAENYSLHFTPEDDVEDDDDEDDDDISEENFPSHINSTFNDDNKQRDPLIVQDESGLIKKIKIPTSKLGQNVNNNLSNKEKLAKPVLVSEEKSNLQRSITPLSREYIALQKSFNDSKILKEFVTDSTEKTRKTRTKDQNSTSTPTTPTASTTSTDHSYTCCRRSNNNRQLTPENDTESNSISMGQTKRHNSRRFVALKEEGAGNSSEFFRSRSKSMHNSDQSDHSNSSTSYNVLKKWPSEGRVVAAAGSKRTNMRSENVEFVQKQKVFLQHVINSTQDTPHRRSRSRTRSSDTEYADHVNQTKSYKYKEMTPKCIASETNADDEQDRSSKRRSRSHSTGNTSGVESTTGQVKHYKFKERMSKRIKADLEDDDKPLSQSIVMECSTTTDDHGDNSSVNNSTTSIGATVNTSPDVTTTTIDNMESLDKHLKRVWQPPPKPGADMFCWKCHESHVNLSCSKCIRSFHAACAKVKVDITWICPECTTVDNILNSTKRSRRNDLSVDLLSQLLAFALNRMRLRCPKGSFSLVMPYEEDNIYKNVIVNPVHFGTLQTKIDAKEYRCAEEFVNDTKWMMHNAYILSSGNSTKTILATKGILKICRQEVNEIETCAECYLNANTRDDWFVDVCSQPHLLLWAKLKGFPYWPAKAMSFGPNSLVNVRFFGQHDRAFVSVKECYLYSIEDPNIQTGKKAAKKLVDCMKEVEEHIEKIKAKVGGFNYAPYKTPYDPADEMKQLIDMMPGVQEFIKKQKVIKAKPSLQFKIYKTADNHLSIVQKATSTPDLPSVQQQQEVSDDFLHTSYKKKKSSSSSEEEKKIEGLAPLVSAKYEVISKITSEDSNSSKLSTVILKRKAANGDLKKTCEDDNITELSLPKMQRIENNAGEADSLTTTKRKMEISGADKAKDINTKVDPKVPVLTIKTTTNKDINVLTTATAKEGNVEAMEVDLNKTTPTTQSSIKPQTKPQPQIESCTSAQKVVENLVKNKQGVTIKKIPKDPPTPPASIPPTSTTLTTATAVSPATISTSSVTTNVSTLQAPQSVSSRPTTTQPREITTKGKSEAEKHRDEQNVNNILKGLVPFVEIKKEIPSDNEEEQQDSNVVKSSNKKVVSESIPASSALRNVEEATREATISSNNQPAQENLNTLPTSLTRVKEEVLSDNEEVNENLVQTAESLKPPQTSLEQVEISQMSSKTNEVRVVGDTTIQKISTRNGTTQNYSNPHKRASLKGVPYGPLPASAYPKLCTESTGIKNDNVATLPRAKKSFPQLSPTTDTLKPAASGNANGSISSANQSQTNVTNLHLDACKRSMAKTTMVAIPVDVAATTRTFCSIGSAMGSIPVPPLTAVSKTTPTTSSYNSMASRSMPVTVTVSCTSGSLTTPSVMPIKAVTFSSLASPTVSTASQTLSASSTPVVARNSPITVMASATTTTCTPVTATTLNTSISTATPVIGAIPPNPLNMSVPPPLAGLSGSNLNSAPQNGVGINQVQEKLPSVAPINVSGTQPTVGPDTHILGGLVTPTLASAITDIICRGPPKLAARPSGPLQSEGHPMFPSQAGPVCKRLVDNAHKLTDFFISVMEDTMGEMALGDDASLQAKITLAAMELERNNLAHEKEVAELKRTSDLMLCEMRKSMENEKTRLVNETRKQCELEWKQRELEWKRLVDETKRKQWCAHCGREANFYCCWNTSYCDYPCQQLHWGRHASNCAQTRPNTQEATTPISNATNLQNSTERHHGVKTNMNSPTSLINPSNASAKALPSNHTKKEKSLGKNIMTHNQLMTSPVMSNTPVAVASSSTSRSGSSCTTPEVLKLPTNTYLRPIANTLSNSTIRCNTTYSIPVQRFNLPITTPANSTSNGPQTFTIVHQGNNWVMSSGGNGGITGSSSSTVAAPIVSIPQIAQHRVAGNMMSAANKSTKTQIRYH